MFRRKKQPENFDDPNHPLYVPPEFLAQQANELADLLYGSIEQTRKEILETERQKRQEIGESYEWYE